MDIVNVATIGDVSQFLIVISNSTVFFKKKNKKTIRKYECENWEIKSVDRITIKCKLKKN